MKIFQPLVIIFIVGLTAIKLSAQVDHLYQIGKKLKAGDKEALFEIAGYFDSSSKVTEYLDYHRLEFKQSTIAKRIITENCLFDKNEIDINDSTTATQFFEFLHKNQDKIFFSNTADAFLITPLDKRAVKFEILSLSKAKLKELNKNAKNLFAPEWVKINKIDSLIKIKDPIALLQIASAFFKERNRFNYYNFNQKEFIDLLEFLTKAQIGVENEDRNITWHIEKDYYSNSRLNLLIFFANYYSTYSWNDVLSCFSNPNLKLSPVSKEDILFEMLSNKKDSIALNAFIQLTTCNKAKVTTLANEYEKEDIEANYSLPTFPYRFLKQLVPLTDYCKANNIDFIGSDKLKGYISLLRSQLTFEQRFKLENELINTLSIDDITAFEYWALIYEQSYSLTYSAGRILDIFYSKNWSRLLKDKKQLDCYFKKSALFDRLGIIGICNNYLKKFSTAAPNVLDMLKTYQSNDSDINTQVAKAILLNSNSSTYKKNDIVEWSGNKDYVIPDLDKQLIALTTGVKDSVENEKQLIELLSKINHAQIGTAIKLIEKYPFSNTWVKYSFLERDFGFFTVSNFNENKIRKAFLGNYSRLSEYNLYAYYLDKAGINFTNPDKSLNFDKIYDLIKYDEVIAFVGGGGGRDGNEIYSLVKLLELTFKTTLGFPKKLCNSNGTWACYSNDRVKAWMKYMEDKRLLKMVHDEPISFTQE